MNATPPSKDSLIDYPCDFPIKVMGLKVEGYIDAMSYVVRQFDPDWTDSRPSWKPAKALVASTSA